MDFYAVLDEVLELLQRHKRVTYRALKRQFGLDDAYLCFEGITAEVHRFEGTINQYTGDGVMALFGAPLAHEDSPRRAVHATLGIQRAIRDVAQALQAERGLSLQMRIGINTMLDAVAGVPLLLLVTYRIGYTPPFGSRSFYTTLTLRNFSETETLAMAGHVLGTAQFPAELQTALMAKAEGVPLFIEEVTKTLLDLDVLRRENGGYRLVKSLSEVSVPDTIQGIIGDYRRAIDCYRQTVASLDGAQRFERCGQFFLPAVQSRAWPAWCYAELGMFAEGSALGDEGLRIAEAVDHPGSLMLASWGIGLLALRQGDLPRALALLERAVGICQDADLPVWFPRMAAALGAAYTLAGRIADAVPLLTQAIAQAIATETVGDQARCRLALGEAQVLTGRLEEAHALAERALAHAREHQERGHQAYALRLLGEVAVHRFP